jgi:hypothetical protein
MRVLLDGDRSYVGVVTWIVGAESAASHIASS